MSPGFDFFKQVFFRFSPTIVMDHGLVIKSENHSFFSTGSAIIYGVSVVISDDGLGI